mmetsp:Transcript_9217/g.13064  ORF Transcript_9217/g.13064 Transcript_9217/m.13064 type:complete len:543 (-) Transcript_9217:96-1724(-)|eukprot:CAMPEP_0184860564 /NCGR_PEP_ID=MMETSP0580-20130426/5430_1 /TAXON_ID=1118495 /ORGANISM="Dactyliosolen fragilissimus" /LENGTH=542 /DNA_ID=CAMNT_0027357715 /DNA_START=187 /DNA_END=1815 /DNA_ORIENTATION=-
MPSSYSLQDDLYQGGTYDSCYAQNNSNQTLLLQCIVSTLDTRQREVALGLDTFLLVYASSLVFFMQAGFAMLCAGSVRLKNVQNTMLKNLLDACGSALGFYSFGFAFAFGGQDGASKTFIGSSNFFLSGLERSGPAGFIFWAFQYAFAATSCTIVAGTLAERCQMIAYLCYSVVLTGFVYPVIVHAVWSRSGFLSAFTVDPLWGSGAIDYAGGGVVHATGGITALFATYVLGPRKGRFYDSRGQKLDKPSAFPGHSPALQVLGSFILWFGWYGFNTGSAQSISTENQSIIVALTAVNTTLAAASGGVVALSLNYYITERLYGEGHFNIMKCVNGCLSGLVAITSGCAVMEPWAAVVTGTIAGTIYIIGTDLLIRFCIDDTVDAIPVHLFNGIWSLISVGLFAKPGLLEKAYGRSKHVGLFYSWARSSSDATLLACQICCILFIFAWVIAIMLPFFFALNYLGWFRADALMEVVGLDVSYHGSGFIVPNSNGDPNSLSIKPEYLEMYNKRKQEHLSKKKTIGKDSSSENSDHDNSDDTVDRIF